jgi:hypothetical protein
MQLYHLKFQPQPLPRLVNHLMNLSAKCVSQQQLNGMNSADFRKAKQPK